MRGALRDGILRPLAVRDFALFWAGMSISLLGDGLYFVAIAWQVYEIDNSPGALSLVGFAWMAPQVAFLLLGGVIADRHERRRVLIAADLIRMAALAALAVLAIAGSLDLWHAIVFVALYGCGEAMFGPAFGAIVPELVPRHLLVQANALDQFVRPLAHRLIGPALGGLIVAAAGAGAAFAVDAATFGVSTCALLAIRHRGRPTNGDEPSHVIREMRDGLRFARSQTWLWATLCAAAVGLLCFWGPVQVLVPYIVKNDLHGGAAAYGLVLAAGGLGAVLSSALIGQRGLPGRHVLFMYLAWAGGSALMAGVALAMASWQAMIVFFFAQGAVASGQVVWATLMHRHVPQELLGRVTSFDWFVSVSLVPLSFLLVGPVSGAIGAEATLVGGTLLAGVATLAFLSLPNLREVERRPETSRPHAPVPI